jgi:hypothetical protein
MRKPEQAYRKNLKKVEKLVGTGVTYLSQLEGAGKALLGVSFKGVYPSDKVPKLNDLAPYCIVNLDRSGQPGSHWVAIAKIEDSPELVFYDSFGRSQSEILPTLNGRFVNTDPDPEQLPLEENCGARCLAWLLVYDQEGPEAALKI